MTFCDFLRDVGFITMLAKSYYERIFDAPELLLWQDCGYFGALELRAQQEQSK